MINDYARRYSPVLGGRQRVAARQYSVASAGHGFWEKSAMVIAPIVLLVVVGSVWCGFQVKADQDNLLLQQAQQRSLATVQADLAAERVRLLARERIEKLAGESLRLYPPAKDQVIIL